RVAEAAPLAANIGARGLHLPETRAREAAHWRALRPSWLITAAAHSLRGLMAARIAGGDAVLIAPMFSMPRPPHRATLAVLPASVMASRVGFPVYALGGDNAQTVTRLIAAGLAGIAAIEGL